MHDIVSIPVHRLIGTNFVGTLHDDFTDPTAKTYQALIEAFEYCNSALFGDRLPRPVFTLQRHRGALGFFDGDRFEATDGSQRRSEIAINPSYLRWRSTEDNLSTIVHEMCHLAQHHFPKECGDPGKSGYHTGDFARIMEAIGLITSSTGKPGGKRTGYKMSHYILPGGRFDQACQELLSRGFSIPYVEQLDEARNPTTGLGGGEAGGGDIGTDAQAKKNASKTKYSCPISLCGLNVWGKPGIHVMCGIHQMRLKASMP